MARHQAHLQHFSEDLLGNELGFLSTAAAAAAAESRCSALLRSEPLLPHIKNLPYPGKEQRKRRALVGQESVLGLHARQMRAKIHMCVRAL